jgi:hypothetical protein
VTFTFTWVIFYQGIFTFTQVWHLGTFSTTASTASYIDFYSSLFTVQITMALFRCIFPRFLTASRLASFSKGIGWEGLRDFLLHYSWKGGKEIGSKELQKRERAHALAIHSNTWLKKCNVKLTHIHTVYLVLNYNHLNLLTSTLPLL